MDKEDIKKLIKKEITPLLIGIRNDLDEHRSKFIYEDSEIAGVLIKGEKGDDGYNPIPDKDYPSEKTVFNFIKENLPKKGKDYFTDTDIKSIVKDVFALMPNKEDLKGDKGNDGVIDYSTVKEIATPIISAKYNELKAHIDKAISNLLEKIDNSKKPEQTAEQIRNKLEGLKGNARLDAKAIKGIEKFIGSMIISGGGSGGQNLSPYWKTDGSSSPATGNWNIGTQNLIFGTVNNEITGTSNILITDGEDYKEFDTTKSYFRYRTIGGARWYDPTNTTTPATINVGDIFIIGSGGSMTKPIQYVTVASVSAPFGSPAGYTLTFVESYTPNTSSYMQKEENIYHIPNQVVYSKSILLGNYSGLNSYAKYAFSAGDFNVDSMLSAQKLFILGDYNNTKGGFYVGSSNNITRSTTASGLRNVIIGDTNTNSSTGTGNQIIIGGSNNISGIASVTNILGTSNTISGDESYVVGTANTITGSAGSSVAFVLGRLNTVSNLFGVAVGNLLKSRAYTEVVLGHNGEDVTALSATSYNALDWQLRLGSGINNFSPSGSRDIFRIRKNGEIWNYLQTATAVGQTIKLFTSHSADAWQIQNVSGTVLTRFTSAGSLQFNANDIITDTTTGTKIGTATTQKLGFWNKTPVIQQVTNAYTSDSESSAYTGIDNLQVGTVYAKLVDLNALRTAYETLRASYDDLLTKLKNTGIVA